MTQEARDNANEWQKLTMDSATVYAATIESNQPALEHNTYGYRWTVQARKISKVHDIACVTVTFAPSIEVSLYNVAQAEAFISTL